MKFNPQERIALLIDGQNLWCSAKTLGFDTDYKLLLDLFAGQATLARAVYFTPMPENGDFTPLRPLVDWMECNGWQVVTKPKGDMGVDIAVTMLEMAGTIHHFVLGTGNGAMLAAVDAVQRMGCRVTVLSSIKAQLSSCSEDLRRAADAFVDLADLQQTIAREPRPARAKEAQHA